MLDVSPNVVCPRVPWPIVGVVPADQRPSAVENYRRRLLPRYRAVLRHAGLQVESVKPTLRICRWNSDENVCRTTRPRRGGYLNPTSFYVNLTANVEDR